MHQGDINLRRATRLLQALRDGGVRHVVISPGARSTPLVLAATRCRDLQTHVIPDERCAAFFALGLGKAGTAPAVVVCTSGTAPANWYPAVIEAAQGQSPLLLISADRPAELQDCGANQTIDQTRLFGGFVRGYYPFPADGADLPRLQVVASTAAQALDRSRWPLPGPVHLNMVFREPLVPETFSDEPEAASTTNWRSDYPELAAAADAIDTLAGELSGKPGLVVAGPTRLPPEFTAALGTLAAKLDCMICADPLSGLRFGPHDRTRIASGYDTWLRNPDFAKRHRAQWILQFGAAPTSAVLQRYLDGHDDHTRRILVTPAGPWPDPGRRGRHVLHAAPLAVVTALNARVLEPAAPDWCAAFLKEERRVHALLADPAQCPPEAAILASVVRQLPAHSRIFAGNSMVIRDCDSFLPGGDPPLALLANRGASGIDGNVSTILGLAAGSEPTVVGLLGDLALYHDMNGLLAAREVNAKLVVFRNGGGAIFGYLPQAGLEGFERYWLTDPELDYAAVARLYGLPYRRVETPAAFETAFAAALQQPDSSLIEVIIDRADSLARHRAFWSRFSG